MEQGDAAIKARIKVHDKNRVYWLEPMFIIKDQRIGRVQGQVPDLGIHAVVEDIDPETGTFTFSVAAGQKDFVVVRAEIKPMINFMWIGTVVLMLGLCMAAKRRFDEFRKMQAKKNL